MSVQEIITELQAIRTDLIDNKICFESAMNGIRLLELNSMFAFSDLYNAFYSSKPETYLN